MHDVAPLHIPTFVATVVAVLLAGFFVAGEVFRSLTTARRSVARQRALGLLLLIVVLHCCLAWFASIPVPFHDHNSNVQRMDRAVLGDEKGISGWYTPTYYAHYLIFHVIPPSLTVLSGVSLFWSVSSLLATYALARASLADRHGSEWLRNGLLVGILLAACHPLLLRTAVAVTFYGYGLTLWMLLLLCTRRLMEQERDVRTNVFYFAVFSGLLFLSFGTIVLAVPGLAIVVVAFLSYPTVMRRPIVSVTGTGIAIAIFSVHRISFVKPLTDSFSAQEQFRRVLELGLNADLFRDSPFLSLELSSLLHIIFAFVGSVVMVRYGGLARNSIFLWYWGFTVAIAAIHEYPLEFEGYPARFLSWAWTAPVGGIIIGVGLSFTVTKMFAPAFQKLPVPQVSSGKSLTIIALACLIGLTLALPFCKPGSWRYFREHHFITAELAEMNTRFANLPQHNVIVIPPRLPDVSQVRKTGGDPLEWYYPVLAHKHGIPQEVPLAVRRYSFLLSDAHWDEFDLNETTVLLYVSHHMRAFHPAEVEDGQVPASLERRELRQIRERFRLEPVETFTIPVRTDYPNNVLVGAHQVEEIELGWYRVHEREEMR